MLVIITLAVYWQVGAHRFISFDDNQYVYDNRHVSSGLTLSNIVWAFTSLEVANWHPLTWLSHMLDVQLYGLNAGGHHISSVVIHAAAAVLLLLLLYRLTGAVWQSALVAALFALHPMHVESVAWVAERKDVLSAFFWFLTLLLYAGYASTRRRSYYLLTLLSFALGLMAKPMLVTLPLVMLLLDVWPLKRVEGLPSLNRWSLWLPLVKEKIPFFVLSLLSVAITIYAQHKGTAIKTLEMIPLGPRIENAAIATVTYMTQLLWPHDLAFYYPFTLDLPPWKFIGSVVILLTMTASVLWAARRHPYLVLGWLWFLITLVPVIGLVQVGEQAMADRYTYIPYTGLFIMLAWGVPALTRAWPHRQTLHALLAAVALLALVLVSWQQIGYWRDGVSLFTHALQVTSNNGVAHNSLGAAYMTNGDLDAAAHEFQEALGLNPNFYDARNNLGLAFERKGDLDTAIAAYRTAVAINPDSLAAHLTLGVALGKQGKLNEAVEELREAIAKTQYHQSAKSSLAHNNLGAILAQQNDLPAAIKEYETALAINPDYHESHVNLGVALAQQGDLSAAIKQFRAGLALEPNYAVGHFNLGTALGKMGELDEAIKEFRTALAIKPNFKSAQEYLDFALDQQRRQANGAQ